MITAEDCYVKYGDPELNEGRFMTMWKVPSQFVRGKIPSKIYCNKDMVPFLTKAFENLINTNSLFELRFWGGCFNIRPQRQNPNIMSLHSWGVAIDINPIENRQGKQPNLSSRFVKCFTEAGFDWGGYWKGTSIDGMHFQLNKI